jgi:hypothetical protein
LPGHSVPEFQESLSWVLLNASDQFDGGPSVGCFIVAQFE